MSNTLPPIDFSEMLNTPPKAKNKKPKKRRRKSSSFGDSFGGITRLIGAMTAATLLLKSGPFIVIGLCGVLLCLKSCVSFTPNFLPPNPPVAIEPSSPMQPYQPPARVQFASQSRPAISRPSPAQPSTPSLPPIVEDDEAFDLSPIVVMDDVRESMASIPPWNIPSQTSVTTFANPFPSFAPTPNSIMGMGSSPPGFFGGPSIAPNGNGSDPSRRFMENTIANPESIDAPSQFSFKRGRKFTGTSQQPGEPSMRVQLTIVSVKDRGTNVTARLNSLEANRFSRNYNGLIETNPLRLTLIPEPQKNGFGTYLPNSPWHSNSPMRIALMINGDKGLSGAGGSEIFEFQPEPESVTRAATNESPFLGFDPDAKHPTTWVVRRKNGKELNDESWIFSSENKSFEWKRGNKSIANGNYSESVHGKTLDIIIVNATSTKVYAGLFFDAKGNDRSVRVCVAREAGGKRPANIDSELGNLYELERFQQGD